MAASPDGTQSIRRAMKLVRFVAQTQQRGARLTELARYTDLTVATASRILRGLTEERLLIFDDRTRSYRVGPLAYELGLAARRDAGLFKRWLPLVSMVAEDTGETAYLVGRSGTEAVCLACISSRAAVRAVPFEVGDRLPLGIGAGSLALLAALPDEEVEVILEENAWATRAFGDSASPATLRSAVSRARDAGFSFTINVDVPGLYNKNFRTAGVGVKLPDNPESLMQVALSIAFIASNDESRHRTQGSAMKRRIAEYLETQPER